jgi:tetratricopeptide (TPR) repeat protein
MARRRTLFPLLLLLALVLAAIGGACARGPGGSAPSDDAGAPVDPALLAFLSRAKSAHHQADIYESDEQLDEAIRALQALVDGPAPGGSGGETPPEVREVLADTLARLADLKSQLGRFDPASDDVERGLGLARETTYFRGHLFEVRGLVEERRSKSLAEQGQGDTAEQAKKRALDAFEKSMTIQAEVIKKAVPEEDAK